MEKPRTTRQSHVDAHIIGHIREHARLVRERNFRALKEQDAMPGFAVAEVELTESRELSVPRVMAAAREAHLQRRTQES